MNSEKPSSRAQSRPVVSSALPRTLTALCAFAVFVLLIGWAVSPAQAASPPKPCDPWPECKNTDDDVPTLATLKLEGGMDYPGELFTVHVGTDSSKKIRFVNTNIDLEGLGVMVRFGSVACQPANAAALDPNNVPLLVLMEAELNGANIVSGFFEAQIDRRNETGSLIFEYTSETDLLSELGTTLIYFRRGSPIVLEGPPDTFSYFGVVHVRQATPGGAGNDLFIHCEVNPTDDPDVVLILHR